VITAEEKIKLGRYFLRLSDNSCPTKVFIDVNILVSIYDRIILNLVMARMPQRKKSGRGGSAAFHF
jgi:hypothetical protein